MNEYVRNIIEEAFKSKAQQRYFFAKGKNSKKWADRAKEFADKTDFSHLPEKVKNDVDEKEEVDEIVDADGNISHSEIPISIKTKGITSKSTNDQVAKTAMGTMGNYGIGIGGGGPMKAIKYWAEEDMSKALGYKETLGKDENLEDAEEHFEDELGIDPEETRDRMEKMGYDEDLPENMVRLVENPIKFVEEYLENILSRKTKMNDVVEKDNEENQNLNPIIKKQIEFLKQTLKDNGIPPKTILKYLNDNE